MSKKLKYSFLYVFLILFFIFVLLVYFNAFSHIRLKISDKLYGGKNVLNNIVIVKIDDESINKIGRWPWSRNVFYQILEKVKDAKVVGIDVSFFEESKEDLNLSKAISSARKVVLAAELSDDKLYKPIFDADFGYVNVISDEDGVVRSIDLRISKKVLPFAFEIYKKGWDKKTEFLNKQYFINFASKPESFDSISAYEVLEGRGNFKDKFVLIGVTAQDLHDNYLVPTSSGIAMSGVEIHANILQNLILDNFLERQGKLSILIFVLIASMIGMFVLYRIKIYYSIFVVLAIIVLYAFLAIFVFSKFNYLLDIFFFPLSVLIFTGAGVWVNYSEERKRTAYLTNAFGKYISKDLLKEIVQHRHELKLGGVKREITIFFSDIRGFTSISEKLPPKKLVGLLNEYFSEMTKIILKFRGTLDKFIGDAIMAFWNAPLLEKEHAKLACQCAIEQVKLLKKLNKKLEKKKRPLIKIGCGIHTGEAVVGNMGSKERFDYTAIGDSVNLASRLEGLTKEYGSNIIVSEETYKKVKDKFRFRKLDKVKVKGKEKQVVIYELAIG